MSKRHWDGQFAPMIVTIGGLIVVGFVAFQLAYSKGYQAADKRHEAENAAGYAAQQDYKECLTKLTAQEALECYQKAEKATRDAQRADEELNAQREMADWAEGMLWATVLIGTLTVAATGLGVWWVRETLNATRDAVNQAVEANRIIRLEQRPWLAMKKPPTVVGSLKFSDRGADFGLEIEIHNVGKLPAKDILTDVQAMTFALGHRPLADLLSEMIERGQPSAVLMMNRIQNFMRRKSRDGAHGRLISLHDGAHGPLIFPDTKASVWKRPELSTSELDKAKSLNTDFTEVLVFVCIDYLIAGELNERSKQTAAVYQLEVAVRPSGGEIAGYSRGIAIGEDIPASELRLVPYRFAAFYAD